VKRSKRQLLAAAVFASLSLPALSRAGQENLVGNGDFEKGNDWPEGWGRPQTGASLEKEGGGHFVRLAADPGQEILLYREVKIQERQKAFELTYRVRAAGIKPGKELWFDARVIANLKDDSGESLDGPPPVFFRKDSKDWVEKTVRFKVPEGATKLELIAGLFRVEKGTFDIDDIVLKPIDPDSVK
jgi:hypothetical protein